MVGYTMEADADTTSRAIGKEMQISPKFSREICRMLKGKPVNDALKMLEEVVELTRPVPIRRYNIGRGAQAGSGPGAIPGEGRQGHTQGDRER